MKRLVLCLLIASNVSAATPPCLSVVANNHVTGSKASRPKTFVPLTLGIFAAYGGFMVAGNFPPPCFAPNGCSPVETCEYVTRRVWWIDAVQNYNPPLTPEETAKLQDLLLRWNNGKPLANNWLKSELDALLSLNNKLNLWNQAKRKATIVLRIGLQHYIMETFTYHGKTPCPNSPAITVTESDYSQWPEAWETYLIPISFTGRFVQRGKPNIHATVCLNFGEFDETKEFCTFGTIQVDGSPQAYLMSHATYSSVRAYPTWWRWCSAGMEPFGVWDLGTPTPQSPSPAGTIDKTKGNNGVGNGVDPAPPGTPPVNDGVGTSPGDPGNKGGANK